MLGWRSRWCHFIGDDIKHALVKLTTTIVGLKGVEQLLLLGHKDYEVCW